MGALADVKTADEGKTAAQCAYLPWGFSEAEINVHVRVGTSKTWISDMTTTSGCGSAATFAFGAPLGLRLCGAGDMPP